jgi:hypothetical protein
MIPIPYLQFIGCAVSSAAQFLLIQCITNSQKLQRPQAQQALTDKPKTDLRKSVFVYQVLFDDIQWKIQSRSAARFV